MPRTTKNFADAIRAKLAKNADLAEMVEDEAFNADIAEEILQCRKELGLTQAQLAERANTTQSVIARVESAEYDGHSLALLRRIARALDRRLCVGLYRKQSFAPCQGSASVLTIDIPFTDVEWPESSVGTEASVAVDLSPQASQSTSA